jgi:hypothetical protein
MGIRVTVNEGTYCPSITCELCDKPIVEASQGNCAWVAFRYEAQGETYPVLFLHKDCQWSWERTCQIGPDEKFCWLPLSYLPAILARNLKINMWEVLRDIDESPLVTGVSRKENYPTTT